MFGLLMVVQDHLVFEGFLAVKAEGFVAGHVSLFSAHAYSYKLLIRRWENIMDDQLCEDSKMDVILNNLSRSTSY